MGRQAPVMNAAAGEARNRTGPAMSAGSPQRPMGVRRVTAATCAGSVRLRADCWVTMKPGATALTLMPSAAQAMASDLVSCCTAALLAP